MYIFLDDNEQKHDFISVLAAKAQSGVRVHIVLDAFGSKDLGEEVLTRLRGTGAEVLFFSEWFRRIHRKVLIVDGQTAFLGGVNIGKRFRHWNDLQIRVHGKIVQRLLKSFAYTYKIAGGKDPDVLAYRKAKARGKLNTWLIEQWPVKNFYPLRENYIEKINSAERSIQIITPYLSPPRWLTSAIQQAIQRKVAVDIIIPRETDIGFANRVNYQFAQKLFNMGVQIHLSKVMNHSKLLIVDRKECILGSQNIDPLSFRINMELGMFVQDESTVKKLTKVFDTWKKESVTFTAGHFKTGVIDYILFFVLKIFRPIL